MIPTSLFRIWFSLTWNSHYSSLKFSVFCSIFAAKLVTDSISSGKSYVCLVCGFCHFFLLIAFEVDNFTNSTVANRPGMGISVPCPDEEVNETLSYPGIQVNSVSVELFYTQVNVFHSQLFELLVIT